MTAVAGRLITYPGISNSAQRDRVTTHGDQRALHEGPEPPAPGRMARLLILLVRGYQALRQGRPSPCRYFPTCSAYAIEAVQRHGAGRGSWLAARRLGRCHPWGGHGADPVPE